MNETIQALLDSLFDALPSTLDAVGKLLDADPQVVELRQSGRTDRAKIRADEDIARVRTRKNIDTAIELIDMECSFITESDGEHDNIVYSSNDVLRILTRVRQVLD